MTGGNGTRVGFIFCVVGGRGGAVGGDTRTQCKKKRVLTRLQLGFVFRYSDVSGNWIPVGFQDVEYFQYCARGRWRHLKKFSRVQIIAGRWVCD